MILEGENIILKAEFTDDNGIATDPQTPVTVTIKKLGGIKDVDGEVATNVSVGVFTYEYTTLQQGVYWYKFSSDDGGKEQDRFIVYKDNTE